MRIVMVGRYPYIVGRKLRDTKFNTNHQHTYCEGAAPLPYQLPQSSIKTESSSSHDISPVKDGVGFCNVNRSLASRGGVTQPQPCFERPSFLPRMFVATPIAAASAQVFKGGVANTIDSQYHLTPHTTKGMELPTSRREGGRQGVMGWVGLG